MDRTTSKRIGTVWVCAALACAVLIVVGTRTAQGGVEVWTKHGLYGRGVTALAVDPHTPSTLYATTSGGVFQSTDSGASWSPVNAGLINTNVNALAIDPTTPSTLYAGTGGGVFGTASPALPPGGIPSHVAPEWHRGQPGRVELARMDKNRSRSTW
jgi:hypothetical protein